LTFWEDPGGMRLTKGRPRYFGFLDIFSNSIIWLDLFYC
jgi:hypothetical protein